MARRGITLLIAAWVLLSLGVATAQYLTPDNQFTGQEPNITALEGPLPPERGDIYYQPNVSGSSSYDLNTANYQACLWDTFDITEPYVLEEIAWYGYLYNAQTIEYWLAPEVGGAPGTPVYLGSTYETGTGSAQWHNHVVTPPVPVDNGKYYYLIMKVAVSGAGYWWCSNIECTNPHASYTSTDLATWTVDYNGYGYEWLAAVWAKGSPGAVNPLTVSPNSVSAWFGGTFTFFLNGGPDLANKDYLLLGSTSGTVPGTPLPGGLVLGINWDWFTDLLLSFALAGGYGIVNDFIGTLDQDGYAEATLYFPGHCQLFDDLDLFFAWCTTYPFDFVSNSVQVKLLGAPQPPEGYFYDDGTSENALGWTAGGAAVWTHGFDSGIGDDIEEISSTFGQDGSGTGPANGTACECYVWSDPNQDGNPSDAGLLGQVNGVVANTSTNTFNHYVLGAPVAVLGKFFVGCKIEQLSGVYAAPMDQSSAYAGHSFFMGAYTGSGLTWDPSTPGASAIYEMGAIGYPANWLLRANDP